MTSLVQEFIEWLRKEGYTVKLNGVGGSCPFYTVREHEARRVCLTFADADEEQPELLVWCLKELERRVKLPLALHANGDGRHSVHEWPGYGDYIGEGPTMTAAAVAGVVRL